MGNPLDVCKLIEKHYKPTIVFSENNDVMTGSARSVKDFNIYQVIEECQDLCEKFGGHKYAAGLTLRKENFEEFKTRFNLLVKNKLFASNLDELAVIEPFISLTLS